MPGVASQREKSEQGEQGQTRPPTHQHELPERDVLEPGIQAGQEPYLPEILWRPDQHADAEEPKECRDRAGLGRDEPIGATRRVSRR